jgi:hypothetical protein
VGSGLATREVKRAVPSLEDQEVGVTEGVATTIMKSDVSNPGVRKAVPQPSFEKQSKKTEAYNLAWFSLWWLRMEREGVKARGMSGMKENIKGFLAKGSSGTGPIRPHLLTTPGKRKANIVMDEPCQTQNCESPAKRSRNKFDNLIKFWTGGGEGGSEKKMAQVLHTTKHFENIHSTNNVTGWDQDSDFSKSNPKMSDNLHEGGRPNSDRKQSFGV